MGAKRQPWHWHNSRAQCFLCNGHIFWIRIYISVVFRRFGWRSNFYTVVKTLYRKFQWNAIKCWKYSSFIYKASYSSIMLMHLISIHVILIIALIIVNRKMRLLYISGCICPSCWKILFNCSIVVAHCWFCAQREEIIMNVAN